jgi:plasmid stability protein
MANLTLKIPDEDLKAARIRALKDGTSVNEVVRKWIQEYGRSEERIRAAMDRVLEASAKYHGKIKGGRFDRSEVYERGIKRGK